MLLWRQDFSLLESFFRRLAFSFGWYPISLAASKILSLTALEAQVEDALFNTLETVEGDTPVIWAIFFRDIQALLSGKKGLGG